MFRKLSIFQSWENALERVSNAVVVIRMNFVRSFEGNRTSSSTATGFVVDKERGLILTNRHVVTPGPVVATASFLNKEEVELTAVYVDPVHDFAFFRFDPSKVEFQKLENIPLAPERAKVGIEIKVVGNDAGERLAILSGNLARLDRNAPVYGGTYSDENCFYFGAASNTSGGSSGSPVVDKGGFAVALNAGGMSSAASSYYLPLDRVVRALKLIQRGECVPRRTIQAVFRYRPYVAVERLGVSKDILSDFRKTFPEATGLLTVMKVLPEGPADKAGLQVGDVLIKLNGSYVNSFVVLEDVMDEQEEIVVLVRRAEQDLTMTIKTDNLHNLTANEFLEISNGIFHTMSYIQASQLIVKVSGVFVASPGFMFSRGQIPAGAVVTSVNEVPTPDLKSFEYQLSLVKEAENVNVSYYLSDSKYKTRVASCRVDRRWFPWRKCTATTFPDQDPSKYVRTWSYSSLETNFSTQGTEDEDNEAPRVIKVASDDLPMICFLTFDTPLQINGYDAGSYSGTAVVVDEERGLVVCDRSVLPHALGNTYVTLGGIVKLPCHVVFVHPLHNLAIAQYDASKVRFECPPGVSAQAEQSPLELKSGDGTTFAGFTGEELLHKQKAVVTLIKHIKPDGDIFGDLYDDTDLEAPGDFDLCQASTVVMNQRIVSLDNVWATKGGTLLDKSNKVQAFWCNFDGIAAGVPAADVFQTVNRMRSSNASIESLAIELADVPMSTATDAFGLSDEWAAEFAAKKVRHAISVHGVLKGSHSADLIKEGDLVLKVGNEPATSFNVVETCAQEAGPGSVLDVLVLRNKTEMALKVPITTLPTVGVERVVVFCGMLVQSPPVGIGFRGFAPPHCNGDLSKTVFCSAIADGSPASLYGVRPEKFIESVNGKVIESLDDLLEASLECADREFVRLHLVSPLGPGIITVKTDLTFFPTFELVRKPNFEWASAIVKAS